MGAATVEESASERQQDRAAFFQQHKRRAYLFALQMVGDPEDAMELTQEAFLRLHRDWGRREPLPPAAPWLYAVLRNLAIDLLRKRAARASSLSVSYQEVSGPPDPEVLAERQQRSEALWRAIQRLPEPQREALLLREFHGLSYAEIARITDSTPDLVASRLHDARKRLRRQLARYL